MAYINWGHESPEQKETRRRFEERELFEQAMAAYARSSSAMAGAAGAGTVIDSSWLGVAKSRLESRHGEITSLVPDLYCFWDDYSINGDDEPILTGINDGGDDMYDGGNYMNTNLTANWDDIKEGESDDNGPLAEASIQYTHTQADNEDDDNEYLNPPMDGKIEAGDNYFGEGSRYFTNMYPGLFVMIADNISISEFNISGNVGSDGNGFGNAYTLNASQEWALFFKVNTDDGNSDPSINQLIMVPGNTSGITQEYDSSSEHDDHRITGISDRNRIIYAVVARNPSVGVLSDSDAIEVAQKILEIVL